MPRDKLTVTMLGWAEVEKGFASKSLTMRSAIAAGVYVALVGVMRQSQRLVPVDFGVLRASAFVAPPDNSALATPRGDATFHFGYGGPAEAYALAQHEGHFDHPEGGQRKFLEEPLRAAAVFSFVPDVGRYAKKLLLTRVSQYVIAPLMPKTPYAGQGGGTGAAGGGA